MRKSHVEVSDDGNYSSFKISHENQHVFECFYETKFGIGLHPYNNQREDIDFYFWLSKNINNPKLYEAYTKELKYI